jgi:hypothetical protein
LPENINERLKEILPEVMSSLQDFIKAFSGQFPGKNPDDLKALFSENLSENLSNIQNLNLSPELSEIFQNPEFRTDMTKLLQNPEFRTDMTKLLQNPEFGTDMTKLLQNAEVSGKIADTLKLPDNQTYTGNLSKTSDIVNVTSNTGINPVDKNVFDKLLTKIKDSLAGIVNMAGNTENDNTSEIFSKYPFLQKLSDFIGKIEDFRKTPEISSENSDKLSILFDKSTSLLSTLEKILNEFSGMGNKENKSDSKNRGNEEVIPSKNIDILSDVRGNISGETGNISSLQNKTNMGNNLIDSKTVNPDPLLNEIDLSEQIVKKIDWKVTKNLSEATITLEPEYLGQLRVELHVAAGGEVSARFFAQNKESGDILLQQLNQLKTSLSDQGLKLGSFSVFTQDSASSGFQNFLSYNNSGGRNYSPPGEDVKESFLKPVVKSKTSQMDYLV